MISPTPIPGTWASTTATIRRFVARSLLLLLAPLEASAQTYTVTASSLLGGSGDDAIRGVRILADGTVVAVGSLAPGVPAGISPVFVHGATEHSRGTALRLSSDGRRVLSVTRFGNDVWDVASDARDNLYLAAGSDGLLVLDASLRTLLWAATPGHVHRVDVAPDGTAVALVPSNVSSADSTPGTGRIVVYAPDGTETSRFDGWRNTLDVAFDPASRTVIAIGWRQASAFDGSRSQPVQIAYLRGYTPTGAVRWTDYDWSTDRDAPDFINRPSNNMADTRGLRVAMGRDGKLYAAFECAGGNHIFRYAPRDITRTVAIVGGDSYHTFSNTRSEHKTFFARYDPADGAYLTGQQFVGRLQNGAGNTVRVSEGAIAADEAGRVYLAGASAFGLPLTFHPPMTGSYTGGAYLVVMSPDLRTRLLVTRMDPGGHAHALDARTFGNAAPSVALGGKSTPGGAEFYRHEAVQATSGGGRDGFVTVIHGMGSPTAAPHDAGAADSAASPGDADVRDADAGADAHDAPADVKALNHDDGPGDSDSLSRESAKHGCSCRARGAPARDDAAHVFVALTVMYGLLHRRHHRLEGRALRTASPNRDV